MIRFLGPKRLDQLEIKTPLTEQIKRTRILVIDDKQDEFPFDFFKQQGYAVDHWVDVDAKSLPSLEAGFYDIVILDIGGVGKQLDKSAEGLAVLKHIRQTNPSQIIVAHSGQSFDSSKIPFFQDADDYVPKPASAIEWKEKLDQLIVNRLTIQGYWKSISELLIQAGAHPDQIDSLERDLARAIHKKKRPDLVKLFRRTIPTVDNTVTIAGLVSKIILLCLGSP